MKSPLIFLISFGLLVLISCSGDIAGGASTEVENPDIRVEISSSMQTSSASEDSSNNIIVSVFDSENRPVISTNILFFEAAPSAYLKSQTPIGSSTTDQFGNFKIHKKLFDKRDSLNIWAYKEKLTAQSTFRKTNIENKINSITLEQRGLIKGSLSSLENLKSIYFLGTNLIKTKEEFGTSKSFSFTGLPMGIQMLIGESTNNETFILGKWNIQKDTLNLGPILWDPSLHIIEDFETSDNIPFINEFNDDNHWTINTQESIVLYPSAIIKEGIKAWCIKSNSTQNLSFQGQIDITTLGDEFSIEFELPKNFNIDKLSGFQYQYTSTADMRFELLDFDKATLLSRLSANAPGGSIEKASFTPNSYAVKYLRWRFFQTGQNTIKIDNISALGLNMNTLFSE